MRTLPDPEPTPDPVPDPAATDEIADPAAAAPVGEPTGPTEPAPRPAEPGTLRRVLVGRGVFVFPAVVVLLWTVLVVAGFSGSSISQLAPDPTTAEGLVAGESRPVRTDEFLVRTPFVASQHARGYPGTSELGLGAHDMAVLYDLPTRDWSTAFRPNLWGYTVLPLAQAYAVDWWTVSLVLLLGTYSLLVVLVRDPRWAAAGAVGLWASPFFHWWYLSASLSVVGFAAAAAAALLASLDPAAGPRRRGVLVGVAAFASVCFALAFYPPFQVPVAIVIGGVAAGAILRRVSLHEVGPGRLAAHLGIVGAAVGVFALLFVVTHSEAIGAISSTVYPGERRATGGGAGWPHLVTAWFGQKFLSDGPAFLDTMFTNESEASSFLLLGVFLLPALPFVWRAVARPVNRLREPLIGLLAALALVLAHMFVGLPTLLTRLTLLDRAEPLRAILGLGVGGVLLTVLLGASLEAHPPPRWRRVAAGLVVVVISAGYVARLGQVFVDIGAPIGVAGRWLPVLAAAAVAGLYFWRPLWSAVLVAAIGIVVSVPVNPVQRGLDVLTDHELAQQVAELDAHAEGDDEGWITTAAGFSPLLTASGVRNLSAPNLYPEPSAWTVLDADRSDEDTWNRYAHTSWVLAPAGTEATLELTQADHVTVTVDPCGAELDELEVGHVVTTEPSDAACLELVGRGPGTPEGSSPWFVYERSTGAAARG